MPAVCYEAKHGNYLRLLYYKAYLTMDDCVQSGGRRAGDTESVDEQRRPDEQRESGEQPQR